MRRNVAQKLIESHRLWNRTRNHTCEQEHGLSPQQAEMVLAGSLINTIREDE
jgi:hypothetical protein